MSTFVTVFEKRVVALTRMNPLREQVYFTGLFGRALQTGSRSGPVRSEVNQIRGDSACSSMGSSPVANEKDAESALNKKITFAQQALKGPGYLPATGQRESPVNGAGSRAARSGRAAYDCRNSCHPHSRVPKTFC
jgi:hypothetical protein